MLSQVHVQTFRDPNNASCVQKRDRGVSGVEQQSIRNSEIFVADFFSVALTSPIHERLKRDSFV